MLDKICTSLEVSKELKEIGIDLETKFYWAEISNTDYDLGYWSRGLVGNGFKAYTLEQLLVFLPAVLPGANDPTKTLFLNKNMWWEVGYPYNGHNSFQISDYGKEGLATIFGKLIIILKENKKI